MSVQSQIDRVTNEVSGQSSLISQIQNALSGKVSVSPNIQPITIYESGIFEAPEGVDGYSPVTVDIKSADIGTTTVTPSSNSRSISFTGLSGEPKMFSVCPDGNTSLSSSTRYATNVVYDGSSTRGIYSTTSTATHTTNGFTWTYNDGTLTISTASTSNGGYFRSNIQYRLTYVT